MAVEIALSMHGITAPPNQNMLNLPRQPSFPNASTFLSPQPTYAPSVSTFVPNDSVSAAAAFSAPSVARALASPSTHSANPISSPSAQPFNAQPAIPVPVVPVTPVVDMRSFKHSKNKVTRASFKVCMLRHLMHHHLLNLLCVCKH